jgi:hypothetical protein
MKLYKEDLKRNYTISISCCNCYSSKKERAIAHSIEEDNYYPTAPPDYDDL